MNVKRKYYAFLFIALVIGIAIGALLNRAIMQRQVKRIMEIRAAGLLVDDVQRFLKPITTEQQLLIQKIIEKHAQALSQIHERFSTEIEAAFKSLKAELDPVLTPEQKKEFEKMIPGRPPVFPRGRRGFPPRREPPPVEFELEALRKELSLSEEQAAKIKAVLERFRNEAKSLMEKTPSAGQFDAFRQYMEKKRMGIEKILTDEQIEKYRRIRRPAFPGPRGRPGERPPGDKPGEGPGFGPGEGPSSEPPSGGPGYPEQDVRQ